MGPLVFLTIARLKAGRSRKGCTRTGFWSNSDKSLTTQTGTADSVAQPSYSGWLASWISRTQSASTPNWIGRLRNSIGPSLPCLMLVQSGLVTHLWERVGSLKPKRRPLGRFFNCWTGFSLPYIYKQGDIVQTWIWTHPRGASWYLGKNRRVASVYLK
jgi:hypothetical protein